MKKELKKETLADAKKREFIKKFGKYAATAPLAGFALMTKGSSLAAVSTGNSNNSDNGW